MDLTQKEIEERLATMHRSPADEGVLDLIVRRPRVGEREILDEGDLDGMSGLVGDSWKDRRSPRTPDGSPHPDTQLTVMNSRVIALLAGDKERWGLAGDQLFVDLDLSATNVPAGTRLALGSAVIEVSVEPHTGCQKFVTHFGLDAAKFVNSALGRQLQLRGINAKVVRAGRIHVGDVVKKLVQGAF